MKLYISIILILAFLLVSCSDEKEKQEKEQKRTETVTQFQTFVNEHYPNWQIKGYHLNATFTLSDIDNNYHSILIGDGKVEKEIIVREAAYTAPDGTDIKRLQEPSKDELDRLAIRKIKKQCKEEANDYEPEPPDPF